MPKKVPYLLPSELTAYHVTAVHAELTKAVKAKRVVDASAVTQVDTLGCQLMVSLGHSLKALGQPELLQNMSAPLVAALTELGLHTFFEEELAG